MLKSVTLDSGLSERECRERIKESSLFDSVESENRWRISHWTLAKGGPLVRGRIQFPDTPQNESQLKPHRTRVVGATFQVV